MAYAKHIRKIIRLKEEFSKTMLTRVSLILGLLMILIVSSANVTGQPSGGSDSPKNTETAGKADQNLKSLARINPSTLAMEMSVPLTTYPGRNGNSLPIGFSYSSKIWRMESKVAWWYTVSQGFKKYVTDINAMFAERSSAGWTSNLVPPRLDETLDLYNQHGKPYSDFLSDLSLTSHYEQNIESIIEGNTGNLTQPCGITCIKPIIILGQEYCRDWLQHYCTVYPGGTPTDSPSQPVDKMHYVKRVRVAMPDGSTHEFRESDAVFGFCAGENNPNNAYNCEQEGEDRTGTFLAVGGSGMKLVRPEASAADQRTFLYLPDGSRYIFPANPENIQGHYATEYIDADGNKATFTQITQDGVTKMKWTDTMGREIVDPMPTNWLTQKLPLGTVDVNLPGLNEQDRNFKMTWLPLKPDGCEESVDENCGIVNGIVPGALQNQSEKLYYTVSKLCQGNASTTLTAGEILFPLWDSGLRTCNPFKVEDVNGTPTVEATRFNPIVLAEVQLPNGKSYKFKYNRYGEITTIIYPAGSYEKFRYDKIPTMSGEYAPVFDQTNRGVVERWVYASNNVLEQHWKYSASINDGQLPYPADAPYKVTTIASSKDDPNEDGMKTERFLIRTSNSITYDIYGNFGFDNPLVGMPIEEKAYDENWQLRSRTLTKYVVAAPRAGGDSRATRDPRASESVSVIFEDGKALATLAKTEYDDAGSSDPEHFSHLNPKRKKSYHYEALDLNTAQTGTLETIAALYSDSTDLAAVSETDYLYNEFYKARGINSLPIETRTLNPANTGEVLAKSQIVYDNLLPGSDADYPYTTQNYSGISSLNCSNNPNVPILCWQSPNTAYVGNPTTSRVWDKDNNSWIETHARYDIFGNVVAARDPVGNETTTEFSPTYNYAYPTKVISPAPDPTGVHGTNQTSQATTTYDFTTGLPLTVTDDFGQTTETKYEDSLLRPTRVQGVNVAIPVTQTIYDDVNLKVTVKKQIDENNWDEATTFSNSLGRTIKTQAKDSEGDIFVETKYDKLGRVLMTSNPYRAGDTVLWNLTEYDAAGRVRQTRAPVANQNPANPSGDILGVGSFDISTVTGYVGTVVTTTDASGRKSRSITNALGQLIRIDEPTATGGTETNDLGSLDNPHQPTFYKYDQLGKMVRVQQGKTGEAAIQNRYFLYDSLGRLIRVRQPEQEVNPHLNTTQSIDGNTQWTAGFVYDVLGNLKRVTDANGTNVITEYDRASRVTKRCYTKQNINTSATECSQISNGGDLDPNTPAVEYFYDGKGVWTDQQLQQAPYKYSKGELTKVTSSISETRYTLFDQFGRLTQSQQITDGQTYTSGYEYNLSGAMVKEIYPSGREVRNELGTDGDLQRIYGRTNQNAAERTYASGFAYTPDGRIQRLRLGNGRWESAQFNNRLQVTELALGASNGDGSLWKLNYEYGELEANGTVDTAKNTGNIARQTLSFNGLAQPLVQSYKYDSLYRLTEARETASNQQNWIQTFGYDRFGNRTGFSQNGNGLTSSQTPTIDVNTNRFVTSGQNFVYDKNGNLVTDGESRQFTFNGENKQREVRNAEGQLVGEYFYDGEGKRVKKKVYDISNGQVIEETTFVHSGNNLIAEYSTAPTPLTPTVSYTISDQLDSPRVITDANGQVTSRRDFMPFGEELNPDANYRTSNLKYGTSDTIRQHFTGYQKDAEINLEFAEARYYNSQHARFTAVDPLLASGKSVNPQTFNRYVYVMNRPLVLIDPTGECPTESIDDINCIYEDIDYQLNPEYWILKNEGFPAVNYVLWGVWGYEEDVQKEEERIKNRLLSTAKDLNNSDGSLLFQNYGGDWIRMTPDQIRNLNRSQTWFTASLVFGCEQSCRQTLSAEQLAGVIEFTGGAIKEVRIDPDKYPEASKHIKDAQKAGKPSELTIDRAGAKQRRRNSLKGKQKVSDKDLDEYPPAVTAEGGAGASVRPINRSDNRGAGASMGRQIVGLPNGSKIRIVVKRKRKK